VLIVLLQRDLNIYCNIPLHIAALKARITTPITTIIESFLYGRTVTGKTHGQIIGIILPDTPFAG
ncbi:MAG: hypothetical protein JRN15_20875, partial [Nitrososphaerota archaeon]|nr:hypothetical protein [Nitrososphaerota archaeon]